MSIDTKRVSSIIQVGLHRSPEKKQDQISSIEIVTYGPLPRFRNELIRTTVGTRFGIKCLTGRRPDEPLFALHPDPEGRCMQDWHGKGKVEFWLTGNDDTPFREESRQLAALLLQVHREMSWGTCHKHEFQVQVHPLTGRHTVLWPGDLLNLGAKSRSRYKVGPFVDASYIGSGA